MAEPKIVDFQPRWARELSEVDRRALDDNPSVGAVPDGPPRIDTRLLLPGGRRRVSFKTLSETMERTQAIAQFAAYDVTHGVNPDFADLRSAGAEVLQLGKLTAEPFEEGSFVIPGRLESEAVLTGVAGPERRKVSTREVVERFDRILHSISGSGAATDISIGALQAIESLGQVIRREAGTIEYSLFDNLGHAIPPIRVTAETVERVSRVRESRRPTQAKLEALEGKVTSLDIVDHKLILNLEPRGGRVKGTFLSLHSQLALIQCFGRKVRLYGLVTRLVGGRPVAISVEMVEILDDEEVRTPET